MNKELNPAFWQNNFLIPSIRAKLLRIAESFNNSLGLGLPIADVLFTGSNASFNFTPQSDVDLHLIFDIKEFNEDLDLVRNFLLSKVWQWNQQHNITLHGYDVEIYTEDTSDKNVANGIYSVLNDRWISEPRLLKNPKSGDRINDLAMKVKQKIDDLQSQFESDYTKAEDVHKKVDNIKQNLRQIRKNSLDKFGILGTGNLLFKQLRNDGYLDKLKSLDVQTYDSMFTEEKII